MENSRPNSPPLLDPARSREILLRPDIAGEFFFPLDSAAWQSDVYAPSPGASSTDLASPISGLRLQSVPPGASNLLPEKECQDDLVHLTQSLVRLRQVPELNGAVLTKRFARSPQPDGGQRIKFGLWCPADGRFRDEVPAVTECHRQIVHAIHRSGFRILFPKEPFLPAGGFPALEDWARQVKLARKPNWPLWLLLCPLLLLLLLCPFRCSSPTPQQEPSTPENFAGLPVTDPTFIIILDKSGSMASVFPAALAETRRLLDSCRKQSRKTFLDVILFDHKARSILGGIHELHDAEANRILNELNGLQAGGGTALEEAIKLAADEINSHGQPTTVLLVTDGEDNTIPAMLTRMPQVSGLFRPRVTVHGTTPRLFDAKADPSPANQWERNLKQFCEKLGGRFGPHKESSQ